MSIAAVVTECIDKFKECLESPTLGCRLSTRFVDFKLWVNGIGALAKNRASLDWRLEHLQNGESVIIQGILQMLKGFLTECGLLINQHLPIDDTIPKIDSSLTDLALLAVAIRRTGRRNRSDKAGALFRRTEHRDLESHLKFVVNIGFREYGQEKTFSKESLTSAQSRLIEANLRRRNLFIAAQRHSIGLEAPPSPDVPRSSPDTSESQPLMPRGNDDLGLNMDQQQTNDQMTQSGTAASIPDTEMRNPRLPDTADEQHGPKSDITQTAQRACYPPRPKAGSKDQTLYQCPCCCQTIRLRDADTDKKWRVHLREDVSPYTCLADTCPTPHVNYATRSELEKHLIDDHLPSRWECPLCPEICTWSTPGDMTNHLKTAHSTNDEVLPTLMEWAAKHGMGLEKCPLCNSSGSRDAPELIKHILQHMHTFSLCSLPWPGDYAEIETMATSNEFRPLPEEFKQNSMLEWLRNLDTALSPDGEVLLSVDERIINISKYQIPHAASSVDKRKISMVKPQSPDYFDSHTYFEYDQNVDGSRSSLVMDDLRSGDISVSGNTPETASLPDRMCLADLLRDRCEKAAFPELPDVLYLPNGTLETLIRPDSVKVELEAHFPMKSSFEIDVVIGTICGSSDGSNLSYRRVFAIIVLTDALDYLDMMLDPERGISDNDLPLLRVDSNDKRGVHLRRHSDPDTAIPCFKRWSFNKIRLFDDWQWSLQAPILEPVSGNYPTFPVRAPLPVRVKMSLSEGGGTGAFSEVFKVKIHPKHHPFSTEDEEPFFALKRRKNRDDGMFERDLRMVRKFEKRNAHPHIIPLLAAWRQGDYSYFLLPWAECDLLKYWEITPPSRTHKFVCWIAQQLEGLAAGMSAIHEYIDQDTGHGQHKPHHGLHGDIKPENILLFKPTEKARGILAISDFGVGVFDSREILPAEMAFMNTYRPPESAMQGGRVSRSWDIWTLGCVFAELVTWLLGGWQLTEDFVDWRMTNSTIYGPPMKLDDFFELVEILPQKDGSILGTGAMVKPKVTQWFQGLHNHKHCTEFTHDILALVEDKMLVVESAIQKRASSQVILHVLRSLVDRCAVDEEYCTKPTPRELPVETVNERPAVMVTLSDDAREVAHRNRASLRAYSGPTEEPATVD